MTENILNNQPNTVFNAHLTHGIKYIGSKRKLLPYIGNFIQPLKIKTALDVFAGTTRVAQYLRQNGIQTDTSDLSWATTAYAHTYVHNQDNTHLQPYIDHMNSLQGSPGWISENYSGGVPQTDARGFGRCFQLKNTIKADAARDYVETLSLAAWEKHTLITAIIVALDGVDNTVGVQQAYLKEWCTRSYNDIVFNLPAKITGPTGIHYEGSCLDVPYREVDLAYLDPPYSPHAYSTYYHIWDSITRWDKPETALKARRRIDRVKANEEFNDSMDSPWNNRKLALGAFEQVLKILPAKYLLISYSNESIVDQADLVETCNKYGEVDVTEIDYARNIMSQIGNAAKNDPLKKQKNKELLILITKLI